MSSHRYCDAPLLKLLEDKGVARKTRNMVYSTFSRRADGPNGNLLSVFCQTILVVCRAPQKILETKLKTTFCFLFSSFRCIWLATAMFWHLFHFHSKRFDDAEWMKIISCETVNKQLWNWKDQTNEISLILTIFDKRDISELATPACSAPKKQSLVSWLASIDLKKTTCCGHLNHELIGPCDILTETTVEHNASPVEFELIHKFNNLDLRAAMAEWLRRLTRNQMGFSRTGSNPVDSEFFFSPN